MKVLPKKLVQLYILIAQSVLVFTILSNDKWWFWERSEEHQSVCPLKAPCEEKLNAEKEDDLVETNNYTRSDVIPCCGHCSCDSDCFKFGTCCLGMYSSFSHGKAIVLNSRYECKRRQYLTNDDTQFNKGEKYWMVAKCADEKLDDPNKRFCENPGIDGDVESLVPVSDFDREIHYRNIYCAFCNGHYDTKNFGKWKLEIHCHEVIPLTDANLLATIKDKKCNIIFGLPDNMWFENDCTSWPPYTISRCNETGLWPVYDEMTESACDAFVDPFNFTYKNYFCYLCNMPDQEFQEDWKCRKEFSQISDVSPPFFAILDLELFKKMNEEAPELNCDTKLTFEDLKLMKCREILCDETNYFDSQKCKTKPGILKDICYKTFIKMIPAEYVGVSFLNYLRNESINLIAEKQVTGFKDVISDMQFFYKPRGLEGEVSFDYIVLYIEFDFSLQSSFPVDIEHILNLHDRKISGSVEDRTVDFHLELGSYNAVFRSLSSEIYVTSQNDTSIVDILHTYLRQYRTSAFFCSGKQTVKINKLLECPFIKIKFDELSMSLENGFLLVQGNRGFTKQFLSWEFRVTEDGVFICLDDYKIIYNALPKATLHHESSEEVVGPKRILSFICVCLSITCLLITIVTYIIFSELQTQPGINNLTLCVCLLLAQTVYQFGAGQQSLSEAACSVIGALCHLLWLSVLFSMNACSIQMFMIFKSSIKLSPVFSKRNTFMTILYICFASMVFVLVNAAVSLLTSNGDSIGYGGTVCFINSYEMHLITFIIPSFLIVAVNLGLFFFVVNRMRKFNIISSQLNQERNYLGINARLSTLTGLTWIFGFLQLLIRQDVIENLFIIFNASQGVFIMIAFVCNHRVYSMIFRKRKLTSSEQGPDTDKTLDQKST